jgi:hypothetical protein
MAQDSGSATPTTARQDIDLDEIEVEILILAKNPNNMKATCSFLARRGWPTTATGNLSKAIEYIAEKRPDIVMVSLNHPSPAVVRLPDLIAQTFNLICVGFVEGTDTASTTKLNSFKIRYKISGTPSGPNFQRGIRRILAEKYNIKEDKSDERERHSGSSGNVNVRGGGMGKDDGVLVQSGPSPVPGNSSIMQEGNQSGDAMSARTGGASGKMKHGQSGAPSGEHINMSEEGVAASTGSALASSEKEDQDLGNVMQLGMGGKDVGDSVIAKSGRKRLKEVTGHDAARDAAGNMFYGENLDPSNPRIETTQPEVAADLVGMLKKSLLGDHAAENSPLGLLEKAVEASLNHQCEVNPAIQPTPLTTVSKVGVFPIESQTLPGFLIVALEFGATDDQKRFLKDCENALKGNFETMGVPAKIDTGFWLDVPEISFQQWVETAGAFNFKLIHHGHEVGVSFFQTEKSMAKAEAAEAEGMHTIDVKEISTNEPVTFKAFLYLKENKKFYLYLRNGRQLQPEQKGRLEESKITQIFLKSGDLENLRMFLASAYLKDTIRTSRDAA